MRLKWKKPWRATVIFAFFLAGLAFLGSDEAPAEPGVTDSAVVIGMSNALSGPASALGTGVKKGAKAYFTRINSRGGVHGRTVKVISYDDGYEPKRTVAHTSRLIQEDKVFALFGYVGTPTAAAILPLINREKIPFFGPFTGAEFLRHPVNRHIFNVRASYFDEAETLVRYLAEKQRVKKIAVFLQNDAYGLAVKGGVLKALKKRGLSLSGEGRYERNTVEVDAGLEEIRKARPDAVVMVGTYKAMAAFIKKAKEKGLEAVFLNVSFVGTAALIQELSGAGEGVMISQVMPSPHDLSLPLVKQYRKDMNDAGHREYDYTDLEGYMDAVVFMEILKKAGKTLTRELFISAAESLDVDVGGLRFAYQAKDHQALNKVYLTRVAAGRAAALDEGQPSRK